MSETPFFAIAIDGPAASGKSTLAKRLAQYFGIVMVNSGAMYRAITWRVLQEGIDPRNHEQVSVLLKKIHVQCGHDQGLSTFTMDDIDLGDAVRSDAVNANVSSVAAIPAVRDLIVSLLRSYLEHTSIIMEGRDIGTVVFPDTPYKIYVTADETVRAKRRGDDGENDAIAARDAADSQRKIAPLIMADDAILLDSTYLDADETLVRALEILEQSGLKLSEKGNIL